MERTFDPWQQEAIAISGGRHLVLGVIAAIIGLVVGIIGWADTVPPRWFWIKSSMDLAGSRFMTALGYTIQFFFIPAAIFYLVELLG